MLVLVNSLFVASPAVANPLDKLLTKVESALMTDSLNRERVTEVYEGINAVIQKSVSHPSDITIHQKMRALKDAGVLQSRMNDYASGQKAQSGASVAVTGSEKIKASGVNGSLNLFTVFDFSSFNLLPYLTFSLKESQDIILASLERGQRIWGPHHEKVKKSISELSSFVDLICEAKNQPELAEFLGIDRLSDFYQFLVHFNLRAFSSGTVDPFVIDVNLGHLKSAEKIAEFLVKFAKNPRLKIQKRIETDVHYYAFAKWTEDLGKRNYYAQKIGVFLEEVETSSLNNGKPSEQFFSFPESGPIFLLTQMLSAAIDLGGLSSKAEKDLLLLSEIEIDLHNKRRLIARAPRGVGLTLSEQAELETLFEDLRTYGYKWVKDSSLFFGQVYNIAEFFGSRQQLIIAHIALANSRVGSKQDLINHFQQAMSYLVGLKKFQDSQRLIDPEIIKERDMNQFEVNFGLAALGVAPAVNCRDALEIVKRYKHYKKFERLKSSSVCRRFLDLDPLSNLDFI